MINAVTQAIQRVDRLMVNNYWRIGDLQKAERSLYGRPRVITRVIDDKGNGERVRPGDKTLYPTMDTDTPFLEELT